LFILFQLLSFLYFFALSEIPKKDDTSVCGILMMTSLTFWALSIVFSLECNFRLNIRRQHLSPSWSQEQSKYQRSCFDRQKLFWTIRKLQSLNIRKSLFRISICLIYKTYKLILSNLILKKIAGMWSNFTVFPSSSFVRFGLLIYAFVVTKFFLQHINAHMWISCLLPFCWHAASISSYWILLAL